MNDANDIPTTPDPPAEPTGATVEVAAGSEPLPEPPESDPEPELEIAVEDDQGEALAALEQKLADEHDRLLRTAAELDNVRKRARRDVDDAAIRGRAEVLNELLPAIDAIDLALKSADEATPAKALIDGVEMVRRQFLGAMGRFGLKPIASLGAAFDPNFHEAVAQIPHPETPAGAVVEELRRGYLLGERLLRASLVIVSSGAPPKATEEAAEAGAAPAAVADGEEGDNG